MIVVTRTDKYTIYKKRNQRYAVKDNDTKQWITGDDKVAVLLAHNLVASPTFKAPDHPEPVEAEASAAPAAETPAADEGEGTSEDTGPATQ
ncbi:MAG: hypothetical protein ACNA7W_16400 [Pseudomonadales bacterium]